jgi:hypothetical protein
MATYKGVVTQGGADTFTSAQILTGLTVDGKAGWQINGFKAFWSNGYTAAAADAIANCVLSTLTTVTLPNADDEIARVSWAVQNTGGVAVAFSFEPIKKAELTEPRVTAQTDLYVHANSTTTGLTNVFYYEISYEIIKLTDLEVLRLLVGGA